MVKSDVERRLRAFADGADFVTCSQISRFIGEKNNAIVRKKYLMGLSRLGDRRYFVPEVAERIMEAMQ